MYICDIPALCLCCNGWNVNEKNLFMPSSITNTSVWFCVGNKYQGINNTKRQKKTVTSPRMITQQRFDFIFVLGKPGMCA